MIVTILIIVFRIFCDFIVGHRKLPYRRPSARWVIFIARIYWWYYRPGISIVEDFRQFIYLASLFCRPAPHKEKRVQKTSKAEQLPQGEVSCQSFEHCSLPYTVARALHAVSGSTSREMRQITNYSDNILSGKNTSSCSNTLQLRCATATLICLFGTTWKLVEKKSIAWRRWKCFIVISGP